MRYHQALLKVGFVLTLVLALFPMGCGGSKSFTPEDFKKVTEGMPEDKVKELLGKPMETLEAVGVKRSFWKVGDSYYSISFADGKVKEPLGPTSKEEHEMMRALMQAAKNAGIAPGPSNGKSAPTPVMLKSFEDPPGQIDCIALTTDGKTLAAGCRDGTVKVWEVATGKVLASLKTEKDVRGVAFSPDGKLLASGSRHRVQVWEVPGGKEKAALDEVKGIGNSYTMAVTFLADGKTLLAGHYDGEVKAWDVESRAERSKFATAAGQLEAMALAPDGSFLAVGSSSQPGDKAAPRVHMYDLPAGKAREPVLHDVEDVHALAFTRDGKLLAVGGGRGNSPTIVNVWDVSTGQKKAGLKGHTDRVDALAFSRDGRLLASGGRDGAARLWDVDTGREVAKIEHPGWVQGVAFGPDGKTLITCTFEKSVQLWDLTPVLNAAGK